MADKTPTGPCIRQIITSLTIAGISLCAGLIEAGGQEQMLKISESEKSDGTFNELVYWRDLCQNTLPFVGVVLLTIISEFGGRKPALAVIIILTITASSLRVPEITLCLKLVYIALYMSTGGIVLLYVCIAEYCEPKYRLLLSIMNISMNRIGYVIGRLIYLYLSEVFPMYYLHFCEIFLSTVCLLLLLTWPESPYWLASKDKQEQTKKSFSMLRRDKAACEKEFKASLDSRGRNYSSKLYRLPFSATIILFSTFWCSILFQNKQLTLWWIPDYSIEYQAAMECLIIFVLFKIMRFYYRYGGIVIILALFISVTFQYSFVILFYTFLSEDLMSDDTIINILMLVSFSISYILVIVGPTTLSISKFAIHIPLKRRSLFMCISGICFFLIKIIFRYLAIFLEKMFGNIILLLVLTTTMVLGIVLSFLMPNTKGKTLVEIEEIYLSN